MRSGLRAAILALAGLVLASCGPTASPLENNCPSTPRADAAPLPIVIDVRADIADQPNDATYEVGIPPCSCDPFVVGMDGGDQIDTGLLDGSTGSASSGGNELVVFEAWSKADRSDLVAGNLTHEATSCGGPPFYGCTISYVATPASYEITMAIPGEASRSVHIGSVSCGETSNMPSSGRTTRLYLANGMVLLGAIDQDFDLRVEDPIFSLNITFMTSGSTFVSGDSVRYSRWERSRRMRRNRSRCRRSQASRGSGKYGGSPYICARVSQDRRGAVARDRLHNADEKALRLHTSGPRVPISPPDPLAIALASPIRLARLLRSARHHAVRLGADVVLPFHVLYAVTLAVAEKTGSADHKRESLLLPTMSLRTLEELHAEFGLARPSPQPFAASALSFSDEVGKVAANAKRRVGKNKQVTLQHVLAALVWVHDPLTDRALLTVWRRNSFQAAREAIERVVKRAKPLAVSAARRWNMVSGADEILSDLYLKLATLLLSRSATASDLEKQPRSYFRAIIENSLCDNARRQAKTLLCDPSGNLWKCFANEVPSPNALEDALLRERQETELERALDRLTSEERDFIRAVYAPRKFGVTAILRNTGGSRFASGFYYRDQILRKLRRSFA